MSGCSREADRDGPALLLPVAIIGPNGMCFPVERRSSRSRPHVSRDALRPRLVRKARREAAIISKGAIRALARAISARVLARLAARCALAAAVKTPCLGARRFPLGAPRPDRGAPRSTCGRACRTGANVLFSPRRRGPPPRPGPRVSADLAASLPSNHMASAAAQFFLQNRNSIRPDAH